MPFLNSKTHWTCSLADVKPGSVWVSLMSSEVSSLKYLNAEHFKKLKGVLIEINTNEALKKNQRFLDQLNQHQIPFWCANEVRKQLTALAQKLYPIEKYPSLIAVTGTNGKTSIAGYLAQIHQNLDKTKSKSAFYSGTLGIGSIDGLEPSSLTTPDLLHFSYHLLKFVETGGVFGSFELSSHALAQKRLKAIPIQTAIFSNISQDHFDYHQDFKHYLKAKKKLLSQKSLKNLVINSDDVHWFAMANQIQRKQLQSDSQYRIITTSQNPGKIEPQLPGVEHLSASHIKLNSHGIHFYLHYFSMNNQEQVAEIQMPIFGSFNIENILLSIAGILSIQSQVNLKQIAQSATIIKSMRGRMQLLNQERNTTEPILFFVDYAHTPDALEKTIRSLKVHFPERFLIAVFGAGGNRDPFKRPKMGKVVNQFCDGFIITSDNSRDEDFSDIVAGIKKGIDGDSIDEITVIEKRSDAIDTAIEMAKDHQPALVLVAGKGHEDTQTTKGKVYHFSDIEYLSKKLNYI